MRITKVPQRKPTEPPSSLKYYIQKLETCSADEIPQVVADFSDWNFPRSDLYLWVPVLNRFDDLLAEIVMEGDFPHMQALPLLSHRRDCLLSILKFSRILLENCSNRTLYASYEHLNDLLCSFDLEIIEHTLWILLRSAQRASHQRSMRISLTVSHERLILLAQPLTSIDVPMSRLLSEDYIIADEMYGVDFSFYRSKSTEPATSPLPTTDVGKSSFLSSSSSTLSPSSSTTEDISEGYIHLHVSPAEISSSQSTSELVSKLVTQHKIPYPSKPSSLSSTTASSSTTSSSTSQTSSTSTAISSIPPTSSILSSTTLLQQETSHPVFALHRKLIIAANIHSLKTRQPLILTRILALATIVHILSEEQIYKVLPHDLVPDLVHFIGLDAPYPSSLKTASIYALDGIALLRGKLQEVLVSLNASVSHGILLSIVRRVIQELTTLEIPLPTSISKGRKVEEENRSEVHHGPESLSLSSGGTATPSKLSGDYFDAMHSLLSHFMSLQNSGSMLLNAGLMNVLVQSLEVKSIHVKYVSKMITMMDSIVYGFSNGFSIFCNCQGLMKLIQRIHDEVLFLESHQVEDSLELVNWVKLLLKFTLHMMQTVSAPEVRNLIDSTLPSSLLQLIQSMKYTSLVAIAVNIMSNFIHGEPTSLSILQELKLPQTFIQQVSQHDIPASADFLLTLPNAFGAISLNHAGLECVADSNALNSFLSIFISKDHLPLLIENDHASILGSGMDELLRHQPMLRPKVMQFMFDILKQFTELGQRTSSTLNLILPDSTVPSTSSTSTSSSNDVFLSIDAISRFLTGLLHSNAHSKDFLERGGLNYLISVFTFPCLTHDFPTSSSGISLLNLIRTLCEIDPKHCSVLLLPTLSKSLHSWKPIDVSNVLLHPSEEAFALVHPMLQQIMELVGLIDLTSEVYSLLCWNRRHPSILLKELTELLGFSGFMKLAEIHQFCLTQLLWLRKTVPPKYYNEPKYKKSSLIPNILSTSSSSFSPTIPNGITNMTSTTAATNSTLFTPVSESTNTAPTMPIPSTHLPSATTSMVPTTPAPLDMATGTPSTLSTTASTSTPLVPMPQLMPTPPNLSSSSTSSSSDGHAKYLLSAWCIPMLDESLPTNDPIEESHPTFLNCHLFHGISQLLTCKKTTDAVEKRTVRTLAKWLVQVGQSHMEFASQDPEYFKQVLGFSNLMLLNERNSSSLQVCMLYYAFESKWIDQLVPVSQDPLLLELFLHLLVTMCHSKQVNDSSFGVALTDLSHYSSAYLLQQARLFTLNYLDTHLSDVVAHTSCKTLLKVFLHLLKADGESVPSTSSALSTTAFRTRVISGTPMEDLFSTEMASLLRNVTAAAATSAPSSAVTRSVVVDPARVVMLTEMGFTAAVAQMALERCHNQVERAAEYILTHPELEFQAAAAASATSNRTTLATSESSTPAASSDTTTTGNGSNESENGMSDTAITSSASNSTSQSMTNVPVCELSVQQPNAQPGTPLALPFNSSESTVPTATSPTTDLTSFATSQESTEPVDFEMVAAPSSSSSTTSPASNSSLIETSSALSSTPAAAHLSETSFLNPDTLQKPLEEARAQFQKKIMPLAVPILTAHEELMMEFKEVIVLLGETEGISYLFQSMQTSLPVFLTLIALLFTDTNKHKLVFNHVLRHQQTFLDIFFSNTSLSPPEVGATWVPLLLIFEGLLNYVDEPELMEPPKFQNDDITVFPENIDNKQQVQAVFTSSVLTSLVKHCTQFLLQFPQKSLLTNVLVIPSPSTDVTMAMSTTSATSSDALDQGSHATSSTTTEPSKPTTSATLPMSSIQSWNQEKATKKITDAVLRLLVRFTRNPELCQVFIHQCENCSPVDLLSKCESLHYVVMILRHLIEHAHPSMLPFVMCNEIKKNVTKYVLHSGLNRDLDTNTIMKTCSYVALRDFPLFLKSAENFFTASKPEVLSRNVPLKWIDPPYVSSLPPSSPSILVTIMEALVQRLLSLQDVEDKPGVNHVHSARIFLMKMTSELVLSYTPCKLALLDPIPPSPVSPSSSSTSSSLSSSASTSSSSKRLSHSSISTSVPSSSHSSSPLTPTSASATSSSAGHHPSLSLLTPTPKPIHISFPPPRKSSYIRYLVEHVLPWPGVHTQSDLSSTLRKKLFESQWASTILSCLCVNPDGDESEKDLLAPIHVIRKVVVEVVYKAMSSNITSKISVGARYGRYLALADTVHRMLSVPSKRRTLSSAGTPHAAEVVPIALVKLFLEKQFVALLTEMLSKIDTHHPQAKFIVTSILKPIEFLAKLSVKMSQVRFNSNIMMTPETPGRTPPTSAADDTTRDSAGDALRHSSLGIMEGHDDVSMREEENEDNEDDDEDEEVDELESYDELSTVELSQASEISEEDEEEDGLDLDMEIVIQANHPHELLAEHDEEASQDAHRRHRHLRCVVRSSHSDSSGDSQDDEGSSEDDDGDDDDDDDDDEDEGNDQDLDDEDEDMEEMSDPMDVEHDDDDDENDDDESDNDHHPEGGSAYSASYSSDQEHMNGMEMEIENEDTNDDEDEDGDDHGDDERSDLNPHENREEVSEHTSSYRTNENDGFERRRRRQGHGYSVSSGEEEPMESSDENGEEEMDEQVDVLNDPFELELELPQTEDGAHSIDFRRALHDGHDPEYDDDDGDEMDEEGLDTADEDYLMQAGHEWFQTLSPHYNSISSSRRILMEDPNRFHQDLLHPLLSSNRNNGHLFLSLPTSRDHRGQMNLDAHQSLGAAVEQMLGGDAMQLLEQLFARAPHASSLEIQVNNDLFSERRIVINNNDPIVNDFKPLPTQERWGCEARLIFGNSVPEKNPRILAHLAKLFLPQALQLKRVKDEADKLQKDKTPTTPEVFKRDAVRLRRFNRLISQIPLSDVAESLPSSSSLTSSTTASTPPHAFPPSTAEGVGLEPSVLHPPTAVAPQSGSTDPTSNLLAINPVTSTSEVTSNQPQLTIPPISTSFAASSQPYIVTINGEQYDLTDSGIDPTFIEALPDELRLEVIQQYILETSSSSHVPSHSTSSSSSAASSSSAPSASTTPAASSSTSSSSTPSTAASSTSILQNQPPRTISSISAQTADTELLYSPSDYDADRYTSSSLFSVRPILPNVDTSIETSTTGQTQEKIPEPTVIPTANSKKKDALHLLDRRHTSTLIGLLFTETPFIKTNLQKLFLSLCENTKTRTDLLSLFMQILIQGLDQVHLEIQSMDRLSTSTVTERCLEMLVYLVRQSSAISHSFVQAKKNTPPPMLGLIEFLNDTQYIEELIELLSVIAQNSVDQPILLPKNAIISLFNVLEGECPLKTFQHLLVVIQSLSSTNFDGFVEVLLHSIAETNTNLLNDLNSLHGTLISDEPLNEHVLKSFSHPASQQARLLRLLKTLDYLITKEKKTMPPLDLSLVWLHLSQCLTDIGGREELVSVLLPLIEAFMVVETQSHDPNFNEFTEKHRKLLNVLVCNNPSLLSGSFSILVNNPKVLEFDNKRNYFYQQLNAQKPRRHNIGTLQLNVRRQFVFEDSFHQLQHKSGEEIKYGKLMVRFYDEEGVDAGGLTREWFSVLARQIFNPDYALFKTSAVDKVTYQPNRASWVNPEHLRFFKFVGRFIGKAIYDQRLLDCYFTRSFYKHMLGKVVDVRDMEAVDPSYYKSLEWILENDINDVIDLTFSVETEDFGRTKIVDLKENGRNIPVTDANKQEYVQLAVEQKLTKAIQEPIAAFLSGLQEIIPKELLRIFNEQELELLISGMPEIDVDDWKNNTEYRNYTSSSSVIQWFWRAVRSFDQEQRAKLVQYCTGTSKVPLEGFKALQGSSGVQKFLIVKDPGGIHRLPSSHTCFNQLDLPEYESYEQLRKMILKAIDVASEGFGIS
ncbi:hypothetical protein HMI56_001495 [Coelomomyces lativittatus]|nr:hypothetical protein HMI56_001495 [Coelomomyces lativittatus]